MKKNFGILPSGEEASLYTISCGGITAGISDYGATLVSLLVPTVRAAWLMLFWAATTASATPSAAAVWGPLWAATPIAFRARPSG